jgi:hypothetical protein
VRRSTVVRGALAGVYAAFFCWYTSFGGPLTQGEITHYLGLMQARGADPVELERLREFLESDSGDDFAMANVIELNATPTPIPGVDAGESSSEVLDKYMAYMWPALLRRACHPVVVGQAAAEALDVWGIDGAHAWSQAAVVRYRSRRDLMEVATNPDFAGPHGFKVAAMAKTIAFPVDPWFQVGDPRLLLALVLGVLGLLVGRGR